MKKIAFFIAEYMTYFDLLADAAKKEEVELVFCLYDDLYMSFTNNQLVVKVKEYDLRYFDLVYFRNLDPHGEGHITISEYCRQNNILVLDEVFRFNLPWIASKNFVYTRLAAYGLPLIDTEFVSKNNYSLALSKISFPCIAKITHGAGGEGVYLCESEVEVKKLFERNNENLILQNFVENDGDIRIYVIGNKVVGAMKRTRVGADEFRNNVSLGGDPSAYAITSEMEAIAIAATKALRYSVSGVDLIFDQKTQSWKIIEINKAPQYMGIMKATGQDIPRLLIQYLQNSISNGS